MTKKEFLKRCETLWEMDVFKDRNFSSLLCKATDAYVRLRDVLSRHPHYFEGMKEDLQGSTAVDDLTEYGNFTGRLTLGSDTAYQLVKMSAVLDHPCQKCAEDVDAWHTRYAFCRHK